MNIIGNGTSISTDEETNVVNNKTGEVFLDIFPNKTTDGSEFSIEISFDDGVVPKTIQEEYDALLRQTFSSELSRFKPDPDDYCTKMSINLSKSQLLEIVEESNILINEMNADKLEIADKLLHLSRIQLACAKGLIGKLEIYMSDDIHDTSGMYFIDLLYFDDFDDEEGVLISGIETFIPLDEEEQYGWLSTLVGGNHSFTHDIAIKCVNFKLSDIAEKFSNSLLA